MGCAGGKEGTPEEIKQNREIEQEMKKTKNDLDREVKLLLLGAGESGKSTIAKQMRIIYLEGFSSDERIHYKDVIHSNLFTSMKTLIQAAQKFEYTLSPENQASAEIISETMNSPTEITPGMAKDFKSLWQDKAIEQTLTRQSEFQLYDSTDYFFTDLERITSPDYVPNEQDILRARAKTTGITETEFDVEGIHFRMVDVGGQRSERKKWIHCFEDVMAVVFCVAMSEYDLKLYEDESVNRMDESLKLFDEICNSKWFANTSIILFLNKCDLFKEKIKKVDLSVCFETYKGGNNYEKASSYLTKKFVSLNKNTRRKEVYPHLTCATDTENVTYVFNVVKDIVIKKVIVAGGVM